MSKQKPEECILCANCGYKYHMNDQHQCGTPSDIITKKGPAPTEEEVLFDKLLHGKLNYNEIDRQTIINFMEHIQQQEPRVPAGFEYNINRLYLNAWNHCKVRLSEIDGKPV